MGAGGDKSRCVVSYPVTYHAKLLGFQGVAQLCLDRALNRTCACRQITHQRRVRLAQRQCRDRHDLNVVGATGRRRAECQRRATDVVLVFLLVDAPDVDLGVVLAGRCGSKRERSRA